ncbi:hypothetical protein [Spirosoma telluris]|uniref:hypothetical protein n=1 Tax=Spirosoma telluris TaxID=2183553 RepID=UPI002FC3A283
MYGRYPSPEPTPDPNPPRNAPLVVNFFIDNTPRPPTALCAPLDQRTPFKPEGWQD